MTAALSPLYRRSVLLINRTICRGATLAPKATVAVIVFPAPPCWLLTTPLARVMHHPSEVGSAHSASPPSRSFWPWKCRECRECAAEACGAVRGKIVGGSGCWTSTAGWTPPAAEGKAPPACFAVSRSGARACACECAMSCRVGVQCSAAESTREEHIHSH